MYLMRMASFKENIMRHFSSVLYQGLNAAAREILGQMERALTFGLDSVDLHETGQTESLDPQAQRSALPEINSSDGKEALMASVHRTSQSLCDSNKDIAQIACADKKKQRQKYFLEETTKDEVLVIQNDKDMEPFNDDNGNELDRSQTEFNDVLRSCSEDSNEEWWVRNGAKPIRSQTSAFEHPASNKAKVTHHTGEKHYSCAVCGDAFSLEIHLKLHKCLHPSMSYSCGFCKKAFTNEANLKTHTCIHTGERPFSCDVCGKAFTNKSRLKRHSCIHTGERPFSCEVCGKAFKKKVSLKQHRCVQRGESQFYSDAPEKAMTSDLKMDTAETKYGCLFCGKQFLKEWTLSRHLKHLSGGKPYICDVCGQIFCQNRLLVQHWRTHTKENNFLSGTTFET